MHLGDLNVKFFVSNLGSCIKKSRLIKIVLFGAPKGCPTSKKLVTRGAEEDEHAIHQENIQFGVGFVRCKTLRLIPMPYLGTHTSTDPSHPSKPVPKQD